MIMSVLNMHDGSISYDDGRSTASAPPATEPRGFGSFAFIVLVVATVAYVQHRITES